MGRFKHWTLIIVWAIWAGPIAGSVRVRSIVIPNGKGGALNVSYFFSYLGNGKTLKNGSPINVNV